MTPEEELQKLIEDQQKDDTYMIYPERINDSFSLDQRSGDGNGTLGYSVGVVYDFAAMIDGDSVEPEYVCYLPRQHGSVLGRIEHGTASSYQNWKCRCPDCTKANSALHLQWVRKNYDHVRSYESARRKRHGVSAYAKGCRCKQCSLAWRKYQRAYWRKRRGYTQVRRTCAAEGCGVRFATTVGRDKTYCSRKCHQRQWARDKRAAT